MSRNIQYSLVFVFLAALAGLYSCGGGGGGGGAYFIVPADSGPASGSFTRTFAPPATHDNLLPFGSGPIGDTKHQILYTASEVSGSGRISAIKFQYWSDVAAPVTCPNTSVRFGHSSLSAMTASFAGNVDRGSLHVAIDNATVTIPAGSAGEWFSIPLSKPFEYNGVDNLVVEIEHTTGCSSDVHIATVYAAENRRAESDEADTVPGVAQHDTVTAAYVDVVEPLQQFVFNGGEDRIVYGGSTNNGIPFAQTNIPEFRHAQLLYHADEINGSGPITGIALVPGLTTGANSYTVTVRLAHAVVSSLTSTFADNIISGSSVTVADGLSFKVPAGIPAGRPIWIPLSGSFSYNGTDNLIVDIEVSGPGPASTFMRGGALAGRIAYSAVGAPTGNLDVVGGYDTYFRFQGATMDVQPVSPGASSSAQVFGRPAGGQIQSLYPATYLGTGGTITSVAVRLAGTPTPATVPNFRIFMGHTNKSALSLADSYSSNMDENKLVYSGTVTIPAGLSAGDSITIPLQAPFAYTAGRNLVILFSADDPGVDNSVLAHMDATEFFGHSVGRNDNSVDTSGLPTWSYDGVPDLRFSLRK